MSKLDRGVLNNNRSSTVSQEAPRLLPLQVHEFDIPLALAYIEREILFKQRSLFEVMSQSIPHRVEPESK